MAHASLPPQTSRDQLAEARVRFLSADAVDSNAVRKPILASWWRSRQWHVAADHIDLSYLHEPDLETRLVRSAEPVLRRLREQLDGQPISIILTDANGLVLDRLTADHDLERALDSVMLAPGFSYAEDRVGTNGIGTALEAGGPAHVFGHEHYAEHLEQFGCAGVPIHDPVSGKTVGVIDLTCWRKDADPLMISLVKATADQITQALVTASSSRDLDLLQEYVRACRRTGGIVLALGNDVVMLNDHARTLLDPGDQAALIGHATEALTRQRHRRGHGGPAQRRGGPGVDPADRRRRPQRRRRGPRQAHLAGRGRARRPASSALRRPARPGRQRRPVAARLPRRRGPVRQLGLDHPGGRGRRRQAGPGPGGPSAPQPGRAVPRARRRDGQPGLAHRDPPRAARGQGHAGHPARRRAQRQADARPVQRVGRGQGGGAPGGPARGAHAEAQAGHCRPETHGCCGSSPAPWNSRRCVITSRTCTSWCRSSWPGSASRAA